MINWLTKEFLDLSVSQLYEILQLRAEVFVVEQTCDYQDLDGKDSKSLHVCGYENEKLIAYARIVLAGVSYSEISIGRVVVSPSRRSEGIGEILMKESLSQIFTHFGNQLVRISAQSHLAKFYGGLGFEPTGKAYLEDGIPHIEMLKK